MFIIIADSGVGVIPSCGEMVRIKCYKNNRQENSGTGFFFGFCLDAESGRGVPAIVTNKHVIVNSTSGHFDLSVKAKDGTPLLGERIPIILNDFANRWVYHPDPSVDLAAFPVEPVFGAARDMGKEAFYKYLRFEQVAKEADLKKLSAVENILMIGYPIGLSDEKNNLPVVRQGITATPPYIDYEGRPEFMIDCSCFPGSSGSPVLLYDGGPWSTEEGEVYLRGEHCMLAGILYAGPQYTAEGKIKIVPVPTASKPIALSPIPTNLGYCIKAEQLVAFEEIFEKQVKSRNQKRLTVEHANPG